MGRTTRYSSLFSEQRAEFAKKVKAFKERQDWSDRQLTQRYNEIVDELLKRHPGSRYKPISRPLMNRFLNMANPRSRGQLRCVRDQDFVIFARMLDVEPATFAAIPAAAALTDMPGELSVPSTFQETFGRHLAPASELLSVAEFLPCSLEDPDFTHWHHKSLFDGLFPAQASCDALVNEYDEIGRLSRDRLDKESRQRKWTFTHIMMQSRLDEIAELDRRDNQYSQCSAQVREKCLRRLLSLLSDQGLKIRLLIVRDRDVRELRWLKAWDSLVVVLNQDGRGTFSFWRDHNGLRQRSEDSDLVSRNLAWLEQLRLRAAWHEPSDVVAYLKDQLTRLSSAQNCKLKSSRRAIAAAERGK